MQSITGTQLATSRTAGRRARCKAEIAFDRVNFVDVSDRLLGATVLSEASQESGDDLGRVSVVGDAVADQCDLMLSNADRELTPWNTAGAWYAYLKHRGWKRLPARVSMGYDNATGTAEYVVVFRGFIEQLGVSVGEGVVSLTALDGACQQTGFRVRSPLCRDVRTDEFLATLIGLLPAGQRPSIGAGTLTMDAGCEVLDWAWAEGLNWWGAAGRVAAAEGGRLYYSAAGKLVFENAAHLMTAGHATSVATFTVASMEQLQATGRWMDFYNAVKIVYRPRRLAHLQTVWSAPNQYTVKPGATLVIEATFQDPVYSIADPKAERDWIATTPGRVKKLTASDLEVTVSDATATACLVTLESHSANALMLARLQLRGRPLLQRADETVTLGVDDAGNYITSLDGVEVAAGWRVKNIDAGDGFILNRTQALRQARLWLDRCGPVTTEMTTAFPDAISRMELGLVEAGIPWLEHGDRVTVSEFGGAGASDFFVTRLEHVFDAAGYTTRLSVVPVVGMWAYPDYFVLGTNSLGAESATPGRYAL